MLVRSGGGCASEKYWLRRAVFVCNLKLDYFIRCFKVLSFLVFLFSDHGILVEIPVVKNHEDHDGSKITDEPNDKWIEHALEFRNFASRSEIPREAQDISRAEDNEYAEERTYLHIKELFVNLGVGDRLLSLFPQSAYEEVYAEKENEREGQKAPSEGVGPLLEQAGPTIVV